MWLLKPQVPLSMLALWVISSIALAIHGDSKIYPATKALIVLCQRIDSRATVHEVSRAYNDIYRGTCAVKEQVTSEVSAYHDLETLSVEVP